MLSSAESCHFEEDHAEREDVDSRCYHLFPKVFTYSLGEGFVLGLLTSAIAAIGDLIESSFKRSAEVKDSGSIIPGRGGILDSIDSVIMAAPVYVAILTIVLGV